jgi:hypothetical protein
MHHHYSYRKIENCVVGEKKVGLLILLLSVSLGIASCDSSGVQQNDDNESPSDSEPSAIKIGSASELEKIGTEEYPPDGDFVLTEDIDATGTANWNDGKGFDPIDGENGFTGTLDGKGFEIVGLTIERGSGAIGLFARIGEGATVRNLILRDASIKSLGADNPSTVGTLAGQTMNPTGSSPLIRIENVSAEGKVSGDAETLGGLVGEVGNVRSDAAPVLIISSEADVDVSGEAQILGGLIGAINSNEGDTRVEKSEAHGVVDASENSGSSSYVTSAGGLTAFNGEVILRSFAEGNVIGASGDGNTTGGLVGSNSGNIKQSFANGDAKTGQKGSVGGLVGDNTSVITNSYAHGDVSGGWFTGGLVGESFEGEVSSSYSTGSVSGNTSTGGLIGGYPNRSEFRKNYWDSQKSGQQEDSGNGDFDGIESLTTDEMQGQSAEQTMEGLDFEETWKAVMEEYPALAWEDLQR